MKKLILSILFIIFSLVGFSQANLQYINSKDSFEIRNYSDKVPFFKFNRTKGLTFPDETTQGTAYVPDSNYIKIDIEYIDYDTTQTSIPYKQGRTYYDTEKKNWVQYNNREGTSLDVGREGRLRGVNMTGGTISDGEVLRIDSTDGIWKLYYANAKWDSTARGTIGFATEEITSLDTGEVALWGDINDLNTIGCNVGLIYLDTVDGGKTSIRPPTPNWVVQLGYCGRTHATEGVINAKVDVISNTSDVLKIFNGAILENHNIEVISNGTIVYLKLSNGQNFITLFFDGTPYRFSIPDSINLNLGSDEIPTRNYVYILNSTKQLTVSTSSFPTSEQFIPIADVLVQSAASAQTYGTYKVHAWTDHLSNSVGQGHLSDINKWIRAQNATWRSGVIPSATIGTNAAALDTIKYSNTSGVVLQLHDHAFPAIDLQGGDHAHVINDQTTAYTIVNNLGTISTDTEDATLRGNNTYYSLVVWGSVSEADADCQLFINKPSGSYGTGEDAENDANNYSIYTIPIEYRGTGFLIARINIRYQTADNGTFTIVSTDDLRGLVPATGAGGGTAPSSSGNFADNAFSVDNIIDNTKIIDFDASQITTGNTRTITMADADVDLRFLTIDTIYTDWIESKNLTNLHINGAENVRIGTRWTDGYIDITPENLAIRSNTNYNITLVGNGIFLDGDQSTSSNKFQVDEEYIYKVTSAFARLDTVAYLSDIQGMGSSITGNQIIDSIDIALGDSTLWRLEENADSVAASEYKVVRVHSLDNPAYFEYDTLVDASITGDSSSVSYSLDILSPLNNDSITIDTNTYIDGDLTTNSVIYPSGNIQTDFDTSRYDIQVLDDYVYNDTLLFLNQNWVNYGEDSTAVFNKSWEWKGTLWKVTP